MATPRGDVIDPTVVGIYHCWTQCVRQLYLFQPNPTSQSENVSRWDFCENRLKYLAGLFAVDVLEYAFLTNHIHTLLRNRPDIAAAMSDNEVAWRWLTLHPGRRLKNGLYKVVTDDDVKAAVADNALMAEARLKLSCISYFQKYFLEPIAKEMNRRDDVKGHFVAGRFDCRRIHDDASLLVCSIYIALNAVRAGIGRKPEDHPYSSFARRVRDDAAWISPLFLDERAAAYDEVMNVSDRKRDLRRLLPRWNQFPSPRISDTGYLPVATHKYAELTAWTFENIRPRTSVARTDSAVPVPPTLEKLVAELGIAPHRWIDTINQYESLFCRFMGSAEQLIEIAKRLNRKYVKGLRACRERFGQLRPSDPSVTG